MTSRSNSTKRGASKSKSAGKTTSVSMPNWVWLLAGLAIGVFVAFLAGLMPSAKDVRMVAEQVASGAVDEQNKADLKKNSQPVFDFYTLLPESEVTVSIADPAPVKTQSKKTDNITACLLYTSPKNKRVLGQNRLSNLA